jgi:hypothetical protein
MFLASTTVMIRTREAQSGSIDRVRGACKSGPTDVSIDSISFEHFKTHFERYRARLELQMLVAGSASVTSH